MSGRGDGTDEDALWRSIVANYGERASLEADPASEAPSTAGAEDLEEGAEPTAHTDQPAPEPRAPTPPRVSPSEASVPAPLDPWVEKHLAEEHFTPPPPDATPLPEPRRLLAWAGVLGVPVALVLLVVLGVTIPTWGSFLMMVWFLGGFGYLVATMRRDDDDGDGWDDGAVV